MIPIPKARPTDEDNDSKQSESSPGKPERTQEVHIINDENRSGQSEKSDSLFRGFRFKKNGNGSADENGSSSLSKRERSDTSSGGFCSLDEKTNGHVDSALPDEERSDTLSSKKNGNGQSHSEPSKTEGSDTLSSSTGSDDEKRNVQEVCELPKLAQSSKESEASIEKETSAKKEPDLSGKDATLNTCASEKETSSKESGSSTSTSTSGTTESTSGTSESTSGTSESTPVTSSPTVTEGPSRSESESGDSPKVSLKEKIFGKKAESEEKEKTPIRSNVPLMEKERTPCFSQLGRKAYDLFHNGFTSDMMKIEFDSRSETDTNFKLCGISGIDGSNKHAFMEGKHTLPSLKGMRVAGKMNSDKLLLSEISIPTPWKQAEVSLQYTMPPSPLDQHFGIKGEVTAKGWTVTTEAELIKMPLVKMSTVYGGHGIFGGVQAGYYFRDRRFGPSQLMVNWSRNRTIMSGRVKVANVESLSGSPKSVTGSICRQLSANIESGTEMSWNVTTTAPVCGIVLKYTFPTINAWLRGKVDSLSRIGFCYSQVLTQGLTLHASAMIDGGDIRGGDHKLGVSLEFDPDRVEDCERS